MRVYAGINPRNDKARSFRIYSYLDRAYNRNRDDTDEGTFPFLGFPFNPKLIAPAPGGGVGDGSD